MMLASSWGAITLQRCNIPQGCGPGASPGEDLPRGVGGPQGLQDSEGVCGRGAARQAPSKGDLALRAHTSDGPHQAPTPSRCP